MLETIGFLYGDHRFLSELPFGNHIKKDINTVINALIFKKRADKSGLFVIFAPNIYKN